MRALSRNESRGDAATENEVSGGRRLFRPRGAATLAVMVLAAVGAWSSVGRSGPGEPVSALGDGELTLATEKSSGGIRLGEVSVSPSTVSHGETVTVSWRLRSEVGIDQAFFYFGWPQGEPGWQSAPSDECPHSIVTEPVSGTEQDATYRLTCLVPVDTPPGTYSVSFMARHHAHDLAHGEYFKHEAEFTVAG